MAEAEIAQRLHKLESFEIGVTSALTALRAALQASPNFNMPVFTDALTYFLATPPANVDKTEFEFPLKILLQDRDDFLRVLKHRD